MKEILSLGAGVQSTTVLLMSCLGELPKLDCAIFSDTQWEPEAVYDHLKWLRRYAEKHGIPVHVVTAGDLRSDALNSKVGGRRAGGQRWASLPLFTRRLWRPVEGDFQILDAMMRERRRSRKPVSKIKRIISILELGKEYEQLGMIRRQCTKEYKIEPIEKFIKRELLGLKPRQRAPKAPVVRHWFGISFDEVNRMRTSPNKWEQNYYPLVDGRIRRSGCVEWCLSHGFPEPPRSACKGCPFHSNAEWRDMMLNRPAEFEDACDFDDSIRRGGGMRGECYLHASRRPLRDIDFRNDFDKGQLSLWQDECAGVCGV